MVKFEKLDNVSWLKNIELVDFVSWLLIFLINFAYSADFDGWRKLIKRKERNIIFFEIPEINLKI